MIRSFCCTCLFLLLTASAGADDLAPAELRLDEARIDQSMNDHFNNRDGWIGADGIYSIPLPDESVLWVFGDTLVGQIRDGRRHDVKMVNNSFARQRGVGSQAKIELLLNRDVAGTATSFVVPENKPGYFWLWDGIVEKNVLYLFATRLTSPGTITAFDWKLLDQSLLIVENPLVAPSKWKIRQLELPMGVFTDDYEAIWGIEVIRVDGAIFVYGSVRRTLNGPRNLVVARVSSTEIADVSRWTYFRDGEWQADPRAASPLATDIGTEGSVTWVPGHQRFVYVYSPPLDPKIQMRTSRTPTGPWSKPTTIYTCPETKISDRIFCYAGKARLVSGTTDELQISYATNSFEMLADVTANAEIYTPRFVRGKLITAGMPSK